MNGLEIAGAIAAIVTAPLAAVASIYAVKSYRRQRSDGTAATQRWLSRIQPRPEVRSHGLMGGVLDFSLINTGGAAVEWVTGWSFRGYVFLLRRPVRGQHQQAGEVYQLTSVGALPLGAEDNDVFVSVAQDEHGQWWDCLRHEQIRGDHVAFMTAELEHRGVGAILS